MIAVASLSKRVLSGKNLYSVGCANGYYAPSLRTFGTRKPPLTTNRRKVSKGKKKTPMSNTKSATTSNDVSPSSTSPPVDPQQLAQEFIQFSAARKSGTESIQELTQTQKLSNYGLAVSLLGFVGWVWYYSMTSVGKAGGGIEQLMSEAEDAREKAELTSAAEKEVGDMVKAEMGLGNVDKDEYGKLLQERSGLSVAVAAPDDIASEEERNNLNASEGHVNKTSKRPLWKKIVLFWKKD